ncbi:MAG TPA: hypothetical protein VI114_12750, partial [Chthoniobacterales bacterium]
MNDELQRLQEDESRTKNWKRWGPYLSERQWATVREDYSEGGDPWSYFPHEHARSRAYRWGEDGLMGITDRQCRLCFAVALWNGHDHILKERLFGLTGPEGNHGEDVKECYFYLDSSPTHSYLKALYKYPQTAFPYDRLVNENRGSNLNLPEFEIIDTGVFEEGRYFDVFAEYAKKSPNDIHIRITVANRANEPAETVLIPTLWFRNTWVWGCSHEGCSMKPRIWRNQEGRIQTEHETLEPMYLFYDETDEFLFTDNETNFQRLYGSANYSPFVKDSFHTYIVSGDKSSVNQEPHGTKVAPVYRLKMAPGETKVVLLRLVSLAEWDGKPQADPEVFERRKVETDEYYEQLIGGLAEDRKNVARQAAAGLLWTKQFYQYIVKDWLTGDQYEPQPPASRWSGRNHDWLQVYSRDVISMPDKWEYPWFAAWDLAFHMLPFAHLDATFAKQQLELFLREWYMHPNGQIPAYEFAFSDVNPPVHAWSAWRVYKISAPRGS